ncbi:MAG: peptidoglycan-associated lipoprotein Pal [Acidobacteriaceae bacterium]
MRHLRKNSALAVAALAAFMIATGCHHKKMTAPEPPPPPAETAPTPTATITASPESFNAGQSVVLTWHTTDATDVAIDGMGAVATSGTKTVNPTATTTYHLTAHGDGGSAEATATVTLNEVAPPPPAAPQQMTEAEFEQSVKPIFFDYDSYSVRPDAQAAITQDASFLQAHPNAKVLIAGYCDDRGSEEYNLALGQNRANAAKTALTQAGVDASRIRTISYGKEKQFCTEQNESCWQQNRRDQFSLDQ